MVSPCFSQKHGLGTSVQESRVEPKDSQKPKDGAKAAESGDGSATEIAPESDEGDAVAEVAEGDAVAEEAVVEAAEGGEAVKGETQEDCWGHGILGGFLCQDQLISFKFSFFWGCQPLRAYCKPCAGSPHENPAVWNFQKALEVLRHVLVCSLTFYTCILLLHLAGVAGEIESL